MVRRSVVFLDFLQAAKHEWPSLTFTKANPAKIAKNAIQKTETFRGGSIFLATCLCWQSPFGLAQAARLKGKISRMLTLSRGNSLLRHFCHSYLPRSGIWWDSCWQTWAVERLVGQNVGENVCCRLLHTRAQWVYIWTHTIAVSHDMLEELQHLCKVNKAARAVFLLASKFQEMW